MDALGELLREVRGSRSRRELARRSGISVGVLQKLEEARNNDVTVGTLLRVASSYELPVLSMFRVCAGIKAEEAADWVAGDAEVQQEVEERLGRRIVIEAPGVPELRRFEGLVDRLERLGGSVAGLGARAEELRGLIGALSGLVAALETASERSQDGHDLEGVEQLARMVEGDVGQPLAAQQGESSVDAPEG